MTLDLRCRQIREAGVSPSSDEQNLNQVAESRFDVAVVEQFHDVFREASFNSTQPALRLSVRLRIPHWRLVGFRTVTAPVVGFLRCPAIAFSPLWVAPNRLYRLL